MATIDTAPSGRITVRNPNTPQWPQQPWTARTVRLIGETDAVPQLTFDVIWGLALDRHSRLYAIDGAKIVRVVDTSGHLLRTLGRPGSGPGEIAAGIGLGLDSGGRLWIADPGAHRYTVYDSGGKYDTTISRPFYGGAVVSWKGRFSMDGTLADQDISFDSTGRPTDVVIRLDPKTGRFDSLAVMHPVIAEFTVANRQYPRAPVPYTPYPAWGADRSGCIWFGVTSAYRISKVCHGDTVLTVEKDWEPAVVTSEERDSVEKRLDWFRKAGGQPDLKRIPTSKPAFSALWVDDNGYLWVRPYLPAAEEGRVLDVFAPTGRYLGPIRLGFTLARPRGPGIDPPFIVRGDLLATTTVDSNGVQAIVLARIQGRVQ